MPTVLGSYSLTVPAAAEWVVGPIFKRGETIRVRAGGTVAWKAVTGSGGGAGQTTILQGPLGGFSTKRTVVYSVPTGTYASGSWLAWHGDTQSTTGSPVVRQDGQVVRSTEPDGSGGAGSPGAAQPDVLWPGGATNGLAPTTGTWHSGGALSASQIADLNAAAGGTLSLVVQFDSGNRSIFLDGLNLTLTTGGGGTTTQTYYALPEGAYPPDFLASHALDPASVMPASAWTGSPLVATGRPPLSLAMLVLPDGQSPPTSGGGAYQDAYADAYPAGGGLAAASGCLSPGRDASYDAAAIGASDPNASYRLWFVVNDGLGDFSDDSGGFSVLVDRISKNTMSEPLTSLTKPRLGLQTALAVRALASRMLGCIADKGFKIKPDQTWEDYGTAGFGYRTGSTLTYDVSSGDVTLVLDTLDTGYLAYSIFGGEVVTTLAPGVYQHVFEYSPFRQAVAPGMSVELPTEQGELVQRAIDLIFNGLKISASPDKRPTASTSFMAGKLIVPEDADIALAFDGSNTGALSPGMNSVQVVAVNGGATGGSFTLLDGNKPGGTINYTAATTASAVQTAVQALATYAGAQVSGAAGGPYTITNPTGREQRPLVPSYTTVGGTNTLTGGTSPSVTVSVTNPGGMKLNPPAPCLAQSWVVSVAPTWAQLENAPVQLTDNWSSEVTIGERYDRKWVQGAAPGTFRYVQKDGSAISDTLSLEMAFVPQVRTFINASRSGSRLAARLRSTGDLIPGTAFNRSLTIDMDGQAKWPDNSDSDNVRSVKIDFQALYNIVSGTMVRLTIVSEVPSYSTF